MRSTAVYELPSIPSTTSCGMGSDARHRHREVYTLMGFVVVVLCLGWLAVESPEEGLGLFRRESLYPPGGATRNEGSICPEFTVHPDGQRETCLTSIGSQDGRVWESSKDSGAGGRLDFSDDRASAIRVGDLRGDLRYRSILSFNTAMIPDDAQILAARLRLKRGRTYGTNPFKNHGACYVDVCAEGFGDGPELTAADFEADATAVEAGRLSDIGADGWSEAVLDEGGLAAINRCGTTQLRLYFKDDDGNGSYDYAGYYSGEGHPDVRPQLIVTFLPAGARTRSSGKTMRTTPNQTLEDT